MSKVAQKMGVCHSVASTHLRHLKESGVLHHEEPNLYALRAIEDPDRSIIIQLLWELRDIDEAIQRLERNRKALQKALNTAIEFCGEDGEDAACSVA